MANTEIVGFKHYEAKEDFNKALSQNKIENGDIVFIKGSKEIHTHGQTYCDHSDYYTKKEIEDTYAKQDGQYPDLIAGTAQNLLGNIDITNSSKYRTVGGDTDVNSGFEAASIQSIQGNARAWNQLVKDGNFTDASKWHINNVGGKPILDFKDNVVTITNEETGDPTSIYTNLSDLPILGHKYLLRFSARITKQSVPTSISLCNVRCRSEASLVSVRKELTTTFETFNAIVTVNEKSDFCNIYLANNYPNDTSVQYKNIQFFDLTLIYGAGNEPTTAEQFEEDYQKWFGKNLTYEEYDEGSIRTVEATGIKTVGFNLYSGGDFEGTVNRWSLLPTGERRVLFSNDCFYKGVFNVEMDVQINSTIAQTLIEFIYIDGTHSFGARTQSNAHVKATSSPNKIVSQVLGCYTDGVDDIKISNICINFVWSGKRNEEYEPHWEETTPLPITTLTSGGKVIFPDGLKRAGSVYDEIKVENGVTKAIKRVQGMHIEGMELVYTLYEEPEEYIIDDFELPLIYGIEDFGTEEFIGEGITPVVITRYGINAVDTIRRLPDRFKTVEDKINNIKLPDPLIEQGEREGSIQQKESGSEANGPYSWAIGVTTQANGYASFAEGNSTIANNEFEHACGNYNNSYFNDEGSQTIFTIGNGAQRIDELVRHNAFEVLKDGSVLIPDTSDKDNYEEAPMINLQDKLKELEERFQTVTQKEYDAIETKDPNIFYFIKEEEA